MAAPTLSRSSTKDRRVFRALVAALAALPVVGLLAVSPSAATTPAASFAKTSGWQGSYEAKYTITAGDSTVDGWRLEFDLAEGSAVGSYWDALKSGSGNHHVFTNRDYNRAIPAGGSATFGFLVSGTAEPANCKLNGQPCGGAVTPTTTTAPPPTTTTPITPPPAGGIRYAPYIDITMERPTLPEVAQATGVKNFTLAFVLGSHAGCDPKWGGTIDLNELRIINQIRDLKAMGGDVVIATGGALGPYLENICGSAAALAGAYRKILDATGATHLDVDVEASIPADLVNQALGTIQRERGTHVGYTLRIQGQDYGVDPFSLQILQSAARNNVDVLVNPMLMNFGYTGDWGDAMISASQAVLRQMKNEVWPSKPEAELRRKLGVTPMIGRNDIGFIGFWSIGRDNGGCPGGGVSPTCSGIAQSQWEFSNIFKGF